MSRQPVYQLRTDEVVARLREFAQQRGEAVTLREFCAQLGVQANTLFLHCGSWKDLRAAAGLRCSRAPRPKDMSDELLLDEFRRLTKLLGRPPRQFEFGRLSKVCCFTTLLQRFGGTAGLYRRARVRDDCVRALGTRRPAGGEPEFAWDEAWLRELWPRIRVGYALRSSDWRERFQASSAATVGETDGRPSVGWESPCDVIFCAVHDWPTAPVPVLVAARVLGERARQPVMSQP